MEKSLTRLEKAVKYTNLACITIYYDIMVNTNVLLQPINKAWLEWLALLYQSHLKRYYKGI